MGDFNDSRHELECETFGDFTYRLFSDMTVSIQKISTSETVNINPEHKVASKATLRLLNGLEKDAITEMYKLSQDIVASYTTTMITKKIEGLCTEVATLNDGIIAVQTRLVTIDTKMNIVTDYIANAQVREDTLVARLEVQNAALVARLEASIKADADVREAKSAAKSAAQAKERLAAETASHANARALTNRDFYLSRQIAELSTRVGKGDGNPRRDDRPAAEKAKFLCRFIVKPGGCNNGSYCPYSHDISRG